MRRTRFIAFLPALWLFAAASVGGAAAPVAPAAESGPSRPRIGLVLGGGGALGLAHVGVLKELEAQRIPIDFIAGTSMGSIVGGLYASGMSPVEIQTLIETLDWDEVMNDETPRRELFFRRKAEDQRFLFEVGLRRDGLKTGAGIAAGQKFNNLMEYATMRSASITEFDRLPVPYRAVATDLKTGEPYVIARGRLSRAMRASMAVPGVFTPVHLDGRILIDGGVVANLPVDVAKAMGAEVVIAVDVGASDDKVDEQDLKTLRGILARTYAIAQRPEQVEMLKHAEVGIQPDLNGFTAKEFSRAAEFVPRGEAAARAKAKELSRYRVSGQEYAAFLARQRRPHPASILLGAVAVTGNRRVSEAVIRGRIRSRPGAPFDMSQAYDDLLGIYGIGEFEQILYRVEEGRDGSSTLTYDVSEKPWGPTYLKYGLRLRSDFEQDAAWSMLLNLTRMSLNALGAEWRNEIEFGSVRKVVSEFHQPLDAQGFLFVAPAVEYRSELEDLYQGDRRVAGYDVSKLIGRLEAGLQLRSYAEARVGGFWGRGESSVDTGASGLPSVDESVAGWRLSLTVDRQDRTVFARQGSYLEATAHFARDDLGGEREYDKVAVIYRAQGSIGDHTLLAGLQFGTSLGTDLPGYAQFTLGGPFGFAGLAENQFRGNYIGVGSLGYRFRLLALPAVAGRAAYLITRIDAGNVWHSESEADVAHCRAGAGLGLGADTALGPLFLGYGLADGGSDRWYFSLGTAF